MEAPGAIIRDVSFSKPIISTGIAPVKEALVNVNPTTSEPLQVIPAKFPEHGLLLGFPDVSHCQSAYSLAPDDWNQDANAQNAVSCGETQAK